MAKKTTRFNKDGITQLPNDKPVVYKILKSNGENVYTGSAMKGRVQERLTEHLPGGKDHIPGSNVQIDQTSSIREAQQKEERIIKRSKPKHNKKGK